MTDPSRRPAAPPPYAAQSRPSDVRRHNATGDTTGSLPVVGAHATPDPYNDPTMPPPTPMVAARAGIVLFAAALTGGIILAAMVQHWVLALAVLAMQIMLVVAYVWLRRPPGPLVSVVTGVAAAIAADWVALYSSPFSLDKLVYVVAGSFGLAIAGQLVRRTRASLTVSLGASMFVATVASGYAMWIGLYRQPDVDGLLLLEISVVAIGAGVMAARACDITLPKPRINRQVPRGAFGIVIGGMFATAGAAYAATVLDGPTTFKAAAGGLVIGLVGVLADLAAGYTQAGRRIGGTGVALWPVRHGLGPLLAFGAAAPVAYLVSVYFTARGW